MTTAPHPALSPTPAGSVLDGDPRVLMPLPEAAERLGISRWQATSWHAPADCPPPGLALGICMCRRRCCAASRRPSPSPAAGWGEVA